VEVDGLALATHEWPGEGAAIVLVHATGLCARTWDPVVALLPNDTRVIAVDLRGHGRSDCPPLEERFRWRQFGEDLACVLDALDLDDATVVGHSMGGHSATVAAIDAPGRVSRLVLLDPTLAAPFPPGATPSLPASEQPSRKRRNEWASPEAFYESLRGRPPFASWDEVALRAYTTHGLRPAGDETTPGAGYVLACPPLFEASIYAGRDPAGLDDELPRVEAEVSIVRGRPRTESDPPGLGPSATRPEVVGLFRRVTDRQLSDAGHFFPQEEPRLAAEAILEAIGE
jgi:pimeloyl-ACP methyl ester carboxylesterase